MNNRIILACAGVQKYWDNFGGTPSHLANTENNIPLLERTLHQLSAYCDDIHVTVPNVSTYQYFQVLCKFPGVQVHLRNPDSGINEYESTCDLWSDERRTILLLGDVYFSDRALRTILKDDLPTYQVFGRYSRSWVTGTPYGEIFAASWYPDNIPVILSHIQHVNNAFAKGQSRRKDGWTLLRSIQQTDLNKHIVKPEFFVVIDDETDDFDKPSLYLNHPAIRGIYEKGGTQMGRTLKKFPEICNTLGYAPEHVLHVGAHLGEELPDYVAAGMKAVTLVEPNSLLINQLKQVASQYPDISVKVLEYACGSNSTTETLHVPLKYGKSHVGSLNQLSNVGPIHTIEEIECHSLKELQNIATEISGSNPDVLVVDTQGRELECLQGGDLSRAHMVIVETTNVAEAVSPLASQDVEVCRYMLARGFAIAATLERDYQFVHKWAYGRRTREQGFIYDRVFVRRI